MHEYLSALIAVAALAAVGELIAYRRGERVHKFAVAIVLLYTVLVPLGSLLSTLGGGALSDLLADIERPSLGEGAYVERTEEAFALGIRRLVAERWGLDLSSVTVTVTGFEFDGMRAEQINIALLDRASLVDRRAVEQYIESLGLGNCEVIYA